jgi:hypothetical protein
VGEVEEVSHVNGKEDSADDVSVAEVTQVEEAEASTADEVSVIQVKEFPADVVVIELQVEEAGSKHGTSPLLGSQASQYVVKSAAVVVVVVESVVVIVVIGVMSESISSSSLFPNSASVTDATDVYAVPNSLPVPMSCSC